MTLRPLSAVWLWVTSDCLRLVLEVHLRRGNAARLQLINPAGRRHGLRWRHGRGYFTTWPPAVGLWQLHNDTPGPPVTLGLELGPGAFLHAFPHRLAPLTFLPAGPGSMNIYLEVPPGRQQFQLGVMGPVRELGMADSRGRRMRLRPVNAAPYLASAAQRHVYTFAVAGKRWNYFQLTIKHGAEAFSVDTRERLGLFLTKPPAAPAPRAQVKLTTADQQGRFLPALVKVFSGQAWWRGIYTRQCGEVLYLPPGPYLFQASHGLEHIPDRRSISLKPRQKINLTFYLPRVWPRRPGWYCGDTHVHSTVSDGYATIPELFVAGLAGGLDWLIVTDHANRSYAQTLPLGLRLVKRLSRKFRLIGIPGLETGCTHPDNHLNVLNASKFIHPERVWRIAGRPGELRYGPKGPRAVFREAMAQDTRANPVCCVVNHPLNHDCAGERILRDCPFFKVFEVSTGNHAPVIKQRLLQIWFKLLNQGRRLAAVAGTDSHYPDYYPVGAERVYCRVPGRLSRAAIVRALREGRSFCVWGPLVLYLDVNGHPPGDTIRVRGRSWFCRLDLQAQSLMPLDRVEVVFNGRVIHTVAGERIGGLNPAVLDPILYQASFSIVGRAELALSAAGWILAVAYLQGHDGPFAVTNPVYIQPERLARAL